MSDGALFPDDDRCPVCGVDPCGCGVNDVAPEASAAPEAAPEWADRMALSERLFAVDMMPQLAPAWATPALPAFVAARAEAILIHGHTLEADRERPAERLLAEARERVVHAIEMVRRGQPGDLAIARVKIATAGGMLTAAFDRILAELGKPDHG